MSVLDKESSLALVTYLATKWCQDAFLAIFVRMLIPPTHPQLPRGQFDRWWQKPSGETGGILIVFSPHTDALPQQGYFYISHNVETLPHFGEVWQKFKDLKLFCRRKKGGDHPVIIIIIIIITIIIGYQLNLLSVLSWGRSDVLSLLLLLLRSPRTT